MGIRLLSRVFRIFRIFRSASGRAAVSRRAPTARKGARRTKGPQKTAPIDTAQKPSTFFPTCGAGALATIVERLHAKDSRRRSFSYVEGAASCFVFFAPWGSSGRSDSLSDGSTCLPPPSFSGGASSARSRSTPSCASRAGDSTSRRSAKTDCAFSSPVFF